MRICIATVICMYTLTSLHLTVVSHRHIYITPMCIGDPHTETDTIYEGYCRISYVTTSS